MTTRILPYSDPIIAWPTGAGFQLRDVIADLQRLNPQLALRCAHGTASDGEYLIHSGTERDVLTVIMPNPPSDELTAGLTQRNYDWMPAETNLGKFRKGHRRFERTFDGSLRIRPFTWELEAAGTGPFNRAKNNYKNTRESIERATLLTRSWFIFRPGDELWEVDFAYMPADYLTAPDAGRRSNGEFWRIVPVGTICYIDEFDLPIDQHYRRAQQIVDAGSAFAVVADVQRRTIRIVRPGSIQESSEAICIPEMPWFAIPVPVARTT